MACCMECVKLIFWVIQKSHVANKVKRCLGLMKCMGQNLMMVSVAWSTYESCNIIPQHNGRLVHSMSMGNQAVLLHFFFGRQGEKVVFSPKKKRRMPDHSLIGSMMLVPIFCTCVERKWGYVSCLRKQCQQQSETQTYGFEAQCHNH